MQDTKNILKKIGLFLLLLAATINVGYQAFDFYFLEDSLHTEGETIATESTSLMANDINSMIKTVESAAHTTSSEITQQQYLNPEHYDVLVKNKTKEIAPLLGVTISFEPGVIGASQAKYSLYYDQKQNTLIRLDSIYDYTNPTLATSKWYTQTAQTKTANWSQPYFGSGAQNLITDYNVPIFRNHNFIGVVSYTISIAELTSTIHQISVNKNGLGILIGTDGTIITHPNPELVLKENISKVIGPNDFTRALLSNERGYFPEYINRKNEKVAVCYTTLANNQWKLINVFEHQNLFQRSHVEKTVQINLCLSITFLIAILFLLIIKQEGINHKEAWNYSLFLTAAFIINIGYIWKLNLSNEFNAQNHTHPYITYDTDIHRFVNAQNHKLIQFGQPPLVEIPTGIQIEKFDYEDTYNVGISGWIWQKYPLQPSLIPAIHFPQISPFAEAAYTQLISQDTLENYLLVKWKFRSTFIFDFPYVKYPFHVKTVPIQICYPHYDQLVIFTPDILGYERIAPLSLPGIMANSHTAATQLISSAFSLVNEPTNGNLGSAYLSEFNSHPVLQYEIKTRTPFLNALIKQIIPILLISIMLFLLLFSIRVTSNGESKIGIETVAGLLFVLVLSHIDFRQTIFSPEITYLETFYFVIYFMIAFVSVNIVLVDLNRKNIITANNNQLIKQWFWPFFFGCILLITLFIFY